MDFEFPPKIAVIGLGYVGLPLAIALARHFEVTGFDINHNRIEELQRGYDRTHEITEATLIQTALRTTSDTAAIKGFDIFIVTVPTPVTDDQLPDLKPLEKASETIGKLLKKNSIVVYESTVYPGVTEEFCGPLLEKFSGLHAGQDFFLGYSPERINPGDKEHTIDRITKVVSGQTDAVAMHLRKIYGTINQDNIFVAKDIKTAEAAKVIENAQRDINIAFVNEIATIAVKLNLSVHDILEAANTKWNFIKFQPGLVGGHCIGVDPYYLAHCARTLNHEPEVILAGRRINENMGNFIATAIHQELLNLNGATHGLMHEVQQQKQQKRILVLGLTFKENIPDLRNTKVIDVIHELKNKGHHVDVHDCYAKPEEAQALYNIRLIPSLIDAKDYDCVIGAVPHHDYLQIDVDQMKKLVRSGGLLADIKNMWRKKARPEGIRYWSL